MRTCRPSHRATRPQTRPQSIDDRDRTSLPFAAQEADDRVADRPDHLGSRRTNHAQAKMRSGSNQRPPGRFNGDRPIQQPQRPPQRGQTFDSNGPNIKIRGTAHQIFERYVALAREAAISDDRVAVENFYQHAEHYFRAANASREGAQQGTPPRPTTPADVEMNSFEPGRSGPDPSGAYPIDRRQPRWDDDQPAV